jgi:hypothetical protein
MQQMIKSGGGQLSAPAGILSGRLGQTAVAQVGHLQDESTSMYSSCSAKPGKLRRIPKGIAPSCADFLAGRFRPAPSDPSLDHPEELSSWRAAEAEPLWGAD